ncbi:hypothetical protein X801_00239, partial [Opisthorchis viverrini]
MRAVPVQVAHSLDTTSFLCAFSRFVARRDSPIRLYRGTEAGVKECLRRSLKASHRGGIWERLIRITRRILRALLGDRLVDDERLQTALIEIEKILNERPLVKLTSDPNDYAARTPNHLLLLSADPSTASH